MKYRRLGLDELDLLKDEFIQFLVVNGIVPTEWEQLKKDNSAAVDVWIEQFSDIVIEKALKNITYLEFREPNQLLFFKCSEAEIELASIRSEGIDLMALSSSDLNTGLINIEGISVLYKSKPYKPNREEEVFRMVQSGSLITDGKLFETLKHLVKKQRCLD
jgi:hypothetical protein